MKIALVHDSLTHIGGAEQVLFLLADLYPDADLYLGIVDLQLIKSLSFGKRIKKLSILSYLPFIVKHSSLAKPILPWYWESLDLSQYDLVISSSHSFSSKSVLTSPRTLHLSYIHTPPRYLYTEYNEAEWIRRSFLKKLIVPFLFQMRIIDFISAQRPDVLIANSKTTQRRIKKYYRRESKVIYPPVKFPDRLPRRRQPQYYLAYSRLVKQKGLDLIIKTCSDHNLPLVVVGAGPLEKKLKHMAGPTVRFAGFVTDQEKKNLFLGAKALLYCSKEEDFGIIPVEVLAHGVPVIAYRSGAVVETLAERKTGLFFSEYTSSALYSTIKKFEQLRISSSDCYRQAQKFSQKKFMTQLKKVIRREMQLLPKHD